MPVYQKLVDFNEVFKNLTIEPIIINSLDDFTQENKDKIKNYTQTILSEDHISALPRCDCGDIKGEYNIGVYCPKCDSRVHNTIEDSLEPILWFRKPEGIPGLINPTIWNQLNNRFRKSGIGLFKWLIDTNFKLEKNIPIIQFLEAQNLPRGYINFVENFDSIMDFFFSIKEFSIEKQKKKDKRDYLRDLLIDYRHLVFTDYWPIINKSLLIVETTNMGIYMDPLVKDALNIAHMLINIDKHNNLKIRENRIVKALERMDNFYDSFNRKIVLSKTGLARKHIFGTRSHFSFRAVITGNMGVHEYDELWLPWSIGVTAFREHILNKLFKLQYSLLDSIALLYSHVYKYHPLLDQILKELIAESPHRGIPVIFQRNPSLQVGSGQMYRVTKFKSDPQDNTVTVSIMTVSSPNADQRI